jgi:hypothetical protein
MQALLHAMYARRSVACRLWNDGGASLWIKGSGDSAGCLPPSLWRAARKAGQGGGGEAPQPLNPPLRPEGPKGVRRGAPLARRAGVLRRAVPRCAELSRGAVEMNQDVSRGVERRCLGSIACLLGPIEAQSRPRLSALYSAGSLLCSGRPAVGCGGPQPLSGDAAASTLAAKLKQLFPSRERRTLSGCAARARTLASNASAESAV